MKNRLTRVAALVVALLVLCAPIGMADSYNTLTFTLNHFSLAVGDTTFDVDATLALDIGYDPEEGAVSGAITALAGEVEALKGGFSYDDEGLIAALDGMTQSALIPAATLEAALQDAFSDAMSDEDAGQAIGLIQSYEDIMAYFSDADRAAAYGEKVIELLRERFADGYQGQVTLTLSDGSTVDMEEYDFSLTLSELMTLYNDMINLDPELAALWQKYFDELSAISGEDVSGLFSDPSLYDDVDMTFSGSFYYNEDGDVRLGAEMAGTDADGAAISVPFGFSVTSGENGQTQLAMTMQVYDGESSAEILVAAELPAEGETAFSIDMSGTQTNADGSGDSVTFTLTSEGADDETDVTFYCEAATTYIYQEQAYTDVSAFGVNYTGTTVEAEDGASYPGTVTLYVYSAGTELAAQFDTNIQLHTVSEPLYTATGTPVDVTTADEEAIGALGDDAEAALMNGVAALMSAPGLAELLQAFGLTA